MPIKQLEQLQTALSEITYDSVLQNNMINKDLAPKEPSISVQGSSNGYMADNDFLQFKENGFYSQINNLRTALSKMQDSQFSWLHTLQKVYNKIDKKYILLDQVPIELRIIAEQNADEKEECFSHITKYIQKYKSVNNAEDDEKAKKLQVLDEWNTCMITFCEAVNKRHKQLYAYELYIRNMALEEKLQHRPDFLFEKEKCSDKKTTFKKIKAIYNNSMVYIETGFNAFAIGCGNALMMLSQYLSSKLMVLVLAGVLLHNHARMYRSEVSKKNNQKEKLFKDKAKEKARSFAKKLLSGLDIPIEENAKKQAFIRIARTT